MGALPNLPGRYPRIVGLLLVLSALAATGCTAGPAPAPLAVASHFAGEDCENFLDDTRQVSFTDSAGTRLAGVEVGTGTTGFVLSHQDPGDVCDWLPFARVLAGTTGYRVLCLDFMGYGHSDDGAEHDRRDLNIVSAARLLRSEGVTRVVLMGASMGANAALIAATEVKPAVAGVISLSAPAYYKGLDAQSAVAGLAVPVLYLAGAGDNGGTFADDARALYAATPAAAQPKLVITSSASHGVNLLSPVDADIEHSRGALDSFLATYASPAK